MSTLESALDIREKAPLKGFAGDRFIHKLFPEASLLLAAYDKVTRSLRHGQTQFEPNDLGSDPDGMLVKLRKQGFHVSKTGGFIQIKQ